MKKREKKTGKKVKRDQGPMGPIGIIHKYLSQKKRREKMGQNKKFGHIMRVNFPICCKIYLYRFKKPGKPQIGLIPRTHT